MGDDKLVRFMFTYRYEGFSKIEYDIASTEEISKENREVRQSQNCSVGEIVRVEMPLPDVATYGAWRAAALRVGEELASSGPDGYHDFTPSRWREWCFSRLAAIRRNELPIPAPASPDEVREAAERADKAMRDVFGGVDKFGDYCGHPMMPVKLARATQDLLAALAPRGGRP